MWKFSGAVLVVFFAVALPAGWGFPQDNLMEEQYDDTALVESTIRETRAVKPQSIHDLLGPGVKQAYLHTFGDEPDAEGNVHGYLKKMNDKGNDGYKHFDSFHKKDGDKYGFEVHSEFGKLDKASVDANSGKHAESEEAKEEDDGKETKKAYKVVEDPEGGGSYYSADDESGESQQYADGGSESEGAEEEESSPYISHAEDGDGETDSYNDEEKSSYSSNSDDGDEESEGYREDSEDD